MINSKTITFLLATIFTINNVSAQQDIQTDRPDQTEGVFIVKKNSLQLESGLMFTKNKQVSNSLLAPNTLIKYGIHKKFEAQLVFDALQQDNNFGVLPISLGFKANLIKEKNIVPEISLIGRVQVKGLGSSQYAIQKSLPMFVFAFKNTLSKIYSIEYNWGMQWNETTSPSHTFSISAGADASKKLSLYAEVFNTTESNDFFNIGVDFGGMYTLSSNWIIDSGLGKYINNDEQDYFFTLGFTTRLAID